MKNLNAIVRERLIEGLTKEQLLEIAQELNATNGTFSQFQVFSSVEELIETYDIKSSEVARMVYFGDIKNWRDDYFRLNGYENIESLTEYELNRQLEMCRVEIIDEYIDNIDELCNYVDYYYDIVNELENI